MSPKTATPLDSLPVGRLGIIPLKSCEKLGNKVNDYIVKWRKDRDHQEKNNLTFEGYERDSYLISAKAPRFGSWWMCATTLSLILCAEKLTICPRMTISRI